MRSSSRERERERERKREDVCKFIDGHTFLTLQLSHIFSLRYKLSNVDMANSIYSFTNGKSNSNNMPRISALVTSRTAISLVRNSARIILDPTPEVHAKVMST